ncbi:hypothetical protein EWH99_04335 [Sporolactobacillus sp. THM7-7]|nr:hypothetical protein EWH99_04335 [Sporolactobacillus sp. THM7-7]
MDWSWLLLFVCPLIMVPMMFMMMKGNHSDTEHSERHKVLNELNDLKDQNNLLRAELRQLKNEEG